MSGVLEHALARAKIPAYFDRGIRRPHPAGRAFLAMLSCAAENFSAKRFAEYLSLAQVPSLGRERECKGDRFMGAVKRREPSASSRSRSPTRMTTPRTLRDPRDLRHPKSQTAPSLPARLRAPWKWEALLVESAVIGGSAPLDAALERPCRRISPPDRRAARRRSGFASHPSLRARAAESRAPARVRAPACRRNVRVAGRSDLGRLAEAPRGIRAAHPSKARARATGAGRSATDGRDRTGLADRSSRRPRRSTSVARSRAAGESIRPSVRRQPASGQRPILQSCFRSRPGGASVSAEAA